MKKQESKFSRDLMREMFRTLIRMNREIFRHVSASLIIAYIVMVAATALIYFAFRYVESLMINHIQTGVIETIGPVLLVYIIVRALPTVTTELQNRLEQRSGDKILIALRHQLILKKAGLDVAYFETSKYHDELQNAEKGVASSELMFKNQVAFFGNSIGLVTGLIAIFPIGWVYVLVILLVTIPSFMTMMQADAEQYSHKNGQLVEKRTAGYFSDLFGAGSIIDLKIFQVESYFVRRWNNISTKLTREDLQLQDKQMIRRMVLFVFATAGIAWVIYSVITSSIIHHTPIGTIAFALGGIGVARTAMFDSMRTFTRLVDNLRYTRDYFKVLDAKPLIVNSGTTKIDLEKGPEIEFQNVSFRYNAEGPDVLKNISFKVLPGEKIGVVGINGSGKTTLMGLLMRFYDPTEGRILVNGQDLKDLDLESYRAYIGFVAQKIKIPKAHTILQIIEMGDMRRSGTVSGKEWDQILNHSGVADFLPDMKDGINQMIGKEFPKGTQLSGGQEQRIAIARVLYRRPLMYIFDEPTSNFDPLIEDRFFTAFNQLPEKATSFLISHSLRIVRNANTILVFDHGTLIEQGSHLKLLQKSGIYAEMFHVQSKDYVRECYAQ